MNFLITLLVNNKKLRIDYVLTGCNSLKEKNSAIASHTHDCSYSITNEVVTKKRLV